MPELMAGRRGLPFRIGDCAAKAGQVGMAFGMPLELARHDITPRRPAIESGPVAAGPTLMPCRDAAPGRGAPRYEVQSRAAPAVRGRRPTRPEPGLGRARRLAEEARPVGPPQPPWLGVVRNLSFVPVAMSVRGFHRDGSCRMWI